MIPQGVITIRSRLRPRWYRSRIYAPLGQKQNKNIHLPPSHLSSLTFTFHLLPLLMHNFFNNDGSPVENLSFSELSSAPLIINIGRQLGSGGREVGKELARRFGMDYYD